MERAEIHELSAAYALHALDPAEREAFEEHLAHCEECREAVAAFQEAAAALAYETDAPAPPPALRERILADVHADGRAEHEPGVLVPFPRRRWAFPLAAAAAVAAGSVALGLAFWAGDLSQQLDEERAAQHLAEETVAAIADRDARRIPLEGANGLLVVHEDTGQGWLVVVGLERAPADKTYEAWVIQGDDAEPAGLFAGGSLTTVVPLQEPVSEDAVVAVTLEQAGGVEQSTQDPLFVAAET